MDEINEVAPVTIDDLTEEDVTELLANLMELSDGQIVSEQAITRAQIEFWTAGRVSIIPEAWQKEARKVVSRRKSRTNKED